MKRSFQTNDLCLYYLLKISSLRPSSLHNFRDGIKDSPRLSPQKCANLQDYQLAVTIYATTGEDETTNVFGRINSGGKQLSAQERRQAGVIFPFAEMVRKIAAELRGDASKEILLLTDMPEISIESKRAQQGYGLTADDTLWCKQGILRISQLRDSEDEEMIADIAASILYNEPIASSRELLDKLYNNDSDEFKQLERKLAFYTAEQLSREIRTTFSVLKEVIEQYSTEPNCLRQIVAPGSSNPIKTAFYAIFMAFFQLIVREEQSPTESKRIMLALKNLSKVMTTSAHYTVAEDRTKNIDKTIGLIQKYFVKKVPSLLRHGSGLAIDFENSVRRSRIETPRYEFKQGLLKLTANRDFDFNIMPKIIETICGIANLGPDSEGFLFIGVADRKEHADRIRQLDSITPIEVGSHHIVGVDREVELQKTNLEKYIGRIIEQIRSSQLSDPLKTHVLGRFDTITYKGFSVVRIVVPPQQDVSLVGDKIFMREGSSTVEAKGIKQIAITKLFM